MEWLINNIPPWTWPANAAKAILEAIAKGVLESLKWILAYIGGLWINSPEPPITKGDAGTAASQDTNSYNFFNTLGGYLFWIAMIIAAISFMILIVKGVRSYQAGNGLADVLNKSGFIFIGVFLLSAGSGIMLALIPNSSPNAGVAGWIQNQTWELMISIAVICFIVGCIKIIVTQREEDINSLIWSVLRLLGYICISTTILNLGLLASDSFAKSILQSAYNLPINVEANNDILNQGLGIMGVLAPALFIGESFNIVGGLVILIIVIGLLLLIVSGVEALLLMFRSAVIMVLAGILPISSAGLNSESGDRLRKRLLGTTMAFLLYKPVGALILATGVKYLTTVNYVSDIASTLLFTLAITLLGVIALGAMISLFSPDMGAGSSLGFMEGAAAGGLIASGSKNIQGFISNLSMSQNNNSSTENNNQTQSSSGNSQVNSQISENTQAGSNNSNDNNFNGQNQMNNIGANDISKGIGFGSETGAASAGGSEAAMAGAGPAGIAIAAGAKVAESVTDSVTNAAQQATGAENSSSEYSNTPLPNSNNNNLNSENTGADNQANIPDEQ
ncbi:MAG: hypothetical protein LBT99_03270 [Bifidobacteriaceae bacterium]|jgi:hypothetical protein|nr:hypothetical protein [Bifidobacteriaceae bacterium]